MLRIYYFRIIKEFCWINVTMIKILYEYNTNVEGVSDVVTWRKDFVRGVKIMLECLTS